MADRRGHVILLCFGIATASYAGCGGSGDTGSTSASSSSSASNASSSVSSSVSSTGSGPGSGDLALPCSSDRDCGSDLHCILPTANEMVFGGGPANGYCSKVCNEDDDCPGFEATCLKAASGMGDGLCVLNCEIGPPLEFINDELSEDKCHGRDDVRCAVTGGSSVCLPTCGKDDQCPAGRFCDPRFAVCVDMINTGAPAGSKCDPMAAAPECSGVCVSFTGGDTSCSSPCVLGGIDPFTSPNCGGLDKGLCAYRPSANGPGDYGFCAPACTVHDQCQNPTFWCFGAGGLTGMGIDNGFCFGVTDCPNGQGQCTNGTCTDTKYGPKCLDEMFPLGSAAPDDAGTDGGTGGSGSTGTGGTGGAGTGGAGTGGAGTGGIGGTGGVGTSGVGAAGGTGGMGGADGGP